MEQSKREAIFAQHSAYYKEQNYIEHNCTIGVVKANVMAFVTAGPLAIIAVFLYGALVPASTMWFDLGTTFALFVFMFGSIIVHELLHGVGWYLFIKDTSKISFGVIWKYLTPYCTCSQPMPFLAYAVGGLFPLFILGGGFLILAIVLQSPFYLFLSVVNILCAGGDTTIFMYLLKHRNAHIVDHPTECGFVAFEKQ